jgi:glycosyltransferase involved in cell wall biosynthesis
MRIAVVTETYPPEINGVALTVRGFVDQLTRLGHAVQLVRPRQPDAPTGEQPSGIDETLVAGAGIPHYPGLRFGLPATRRLRALWTRARPDTAYIATEGPLGHSALKVAVELGVPTATGFHTRFDDFVAHYGAAWLTPAVFAWLRRFHNRANATLVPTRELREYLDSHGFLNVRVLSRGVDTVQFAPARRDAALRAQWSLGDDDLAVLFVGRIAPEKNLDLAVRSYDAIRAAVPGARMVWIGDGPALARLRRDHPGHVFCGMQRGIELARHFASGDMFLFPSVTETFGNVTLEALASGVPPVAYHYGAAREMVRDGIDGRTVPIHDADAFVAAAVALARDRPLRATMRASGRQVVANLSHAAVAQALAELLDGLRERRAA